jgi:hypothetical protein
MKIATSLLTLSLALASARAGSHASANYSVPADTTDAGGRRTASANYSNDGSLGGIGGGISEGGSPVEAVKHGYIGQLFEVTGLMVAATPTNVNEGATSQLIASASLDDGTVLASLGGSATWTIVSGPIASISGDGLATAANVYQNTPATVRGAVGSLSGTISLTVLNVGNDDFGAYAGDGLDDAWQVRYFGLNNPNAAPNADPDHDGQSNLFEYIAGTDPTNSASRFSLNISNAAQPGQKLLVFNPRLTNRTYTVQFRTNAATGSFSNLLTSITGDVGSTRNVTDTNAVQSRKFYRVNIAFP